MTKQKNTKRALLASVLSMMLCVAMLIGSTFAWFTDSVTSGNNRIVAGNLKIDLVMDKTGDGTYVSIANGEGDIFTEAGIAQNSNATLWEPGKTQVVYLGVQNKGSLALKYNIVLNVVDGGLIGSLEYAILDGKKAADLSGITSWTELKAMSGAQTDDMVAGSVTAAPNGRLDEIVNGVKDETDYFALAVHMKETADNTFQGKDVTIDVTVVATQADAESDSFGNDYDSGANYGISVWDGSSRTAIADLDADAEKKTVVLHSAADFAGFAAAVNADELQDYNVTLVTDINLNGKEWTPAGNGSRSGSAPSGNQFKGSFDGKGHTVSGLTITGNAEQDEAIGLFGVVNGGTVKNLNLTDVNINVPANEMAGAAVGMLTGGGTVSGITVSGNVSANRGNGGIVGRMTKAGTISDCTNRATLSATGANVGGIVGAAYYTSTDGVMTIENCVNEGKITGEYAAAGGIAGLSAADITNCINKAPVIGNGTSIGGIIGEQTAYGHITSCENTADVLNKSTGYGTGGIIGWVRYNNDNTAYPKKAMIEISGNTNSGSIKGGDSAGGIVGHIYNQALVKDNTNTAIEINAKTFAAGIAGSLQAGDGNAFYSDLDIQVIENTSTTPIDSITGGCKDLFAYNNNKNAFTVKDNYDIVPDEGNEEDPF